MVVVVVVVSTDYAIGDVSKPSQDPLVALHGILLADSFLGRFGNVPALRYAPRNGYQLLKNAKAASRCVQHTLLPRRYLSTWRGLTSCSCVHLVVCVLYPHRATLSAVAFPNVSPSSPTRIASLNGRTVTVLNILSKVLEPSLASRTAETYVRGGVSKDGYPLLQFSVIRPMLDYPSDAVLQAQGSAVLHTLVANNAQWLAVCAGRAHILLLWLPPLRAVYACVPQHAACCLSLPWW